jgi:hypothetical protein
MKKSTKGYKKPSDGEFILRDGWYWPKNACNNGHISPRNYFGQCVQCVRDYRKSKGYFRNETDKKWREKNREKLNRERASYNATRNHITLLNASKVTARKRGVPHSITAEDIVIPNVCPVLGIYIVRQNGLRTDNSPSIDRIRPELGYVKGNVIVVSWRANRLKQDASIDELIKIYNFYKKILH